jgi:hypothetical protein
MPILGNQQPAFFLATFSPLKSSWHLASGIIGVLSEKSHDCWTHFNQSINQSVAFIALHWTSEAN